MTNLAKCARLRAANDGLPCLRRRTRRRCYCTVTAMAPPCLVHVSSLWHLHRRCHMARRPAQLGPRPLCCPRVKPPGLHPRLFPACQLSFNTRGGRGTRRAVATCTPPHLPRKRAQWLQQTRQSAHGVGRTSPWVWRRCPPSSGARRRPWCRDQTRVPSFTSCRLATETFVF